MRRHVVGIDLVALEMYKQIMHEDVLKSGRDRSERCIRDQGRRRLIYLEFVKMTANESELHRSKLGAITNAKLWLRRINRTRCSSVRLF